MSRERTIHGAGGLQLCLVQHLHMRTEAVRKSLLSWCDRHQSNGTSDFTVPLWLHRRPGLPLRREK